MKKLILFLVFVAISSALYAGVTFDLSVAEEDIELIQATLDRLNRGNDDVDFEVASFKKEDDFVSFELFFNDKSILISSRESNLSEEIKNALFYEESLYLDSDDRLDYIWSGSFSFVPSKSYRKGTTLEARDANGKREGVFEVKKSFDSVTVLQPIYIKDDVVPGLELRKSSDFRYALSGATNFRRNSMAFSFEVGVTSWIYPFMPTASVFCLQSQNSFSFYLGLGISGYLDLNDVLSWSFTMIEEGRIGANATLLLGLSDGSFAYNGAYSIYYEHRVLAKMFYRVGYSYYPKIANSLVLSIGGSF